MSIVSKVKSFYSKHTYPNYPILARPLWQYGYLGSSFFAANLLSSITETIPSILRFNISKKVNDPVNRKNILIIGCGEILPYITRKFEPTYHNIYCVDLSSNSLNRASLRLKLSFNLKPIHFIEDDINHFLDSTDLVFDHVDCFGVLHHLSDPRITLSKLRSHMSEGSTLRIMVYNYPARWWIHYIECIFKLCGYSYNSKKDIDLAKSWLYKLKKKYPNSVLSYYLDSVGRFLLDNPARFSDTFLHPRVIRRSIGYWFSIFKDTDLIPFSMYDRYQELWDKSAPSSSLFSIPSENMLEDLSKSGIFLENLELYLRAGHKKPDIFQIDKNFTTTIKDYPLWYRILLFIKEFLPHIFRSSPFKQSGSAKGYLWRTWIRSIFFNTKIKSSFDESRIYLFLDRGYIFPTMISSSKKGSILKKIKSSYFKNYKPNEKYDYSYNNSCLYQQTLNQINLNKLIPDSLLPSIASALSDKKKTQIKRRLHVLIQDHKDN